MARQSTGKSPTSLVLLFLAVTITLETIQAHPVSSPEVLSKSTKTSNAISNSQQQQQQQQQQQHHQQQQQQQQPKSQSQDSQLHSLTVYATNYDPTSPDSSESQGSGVSFKSSYKLPDMESNFTPIQSSQQTNLPAPTPLIMQYYAQPITTNNGPNGPVQYMQLIPARPLILPMNSFISPPATETKPYQPSLITEHAYPGRLLSSPMISLTSHSHTPPMPAPAPPLTMPYGLSTYANTIQPYRPAYRFNREIKSNKLVGPLNLNMNEYLPGPGQEAPPSHMYVRGRP